MPPRPLTTLVVIVTVWCVFITFLYISRFSIKQDNEVIVSLQYEQRLQVIANQVDKLEREYKNEINIIKKEIAKINKGAVGSTIPNESSPIAVLIMACNRVTVTRAIDSVLKYRPSQDKFPVIVSQDCGHDETAKAISYYKNKLTHIMQPDTSDITVPKNEKRMVGYYKISRHFKWALTQVFDNYGYKLAIIIEDDLEVGPDFFSYMEATSSLLLHDKTLMCVSAWNDNGKKELIDTSRYDLLYRSDFFPGLGWMLTVDLWHELKPKWPVSYWDDWLRLNVQRQGRSCIRPEISRTMTFGRIGVSNGQHFDKHLKYITLSDGNYDFKRANLSYLLKDNYEVYFVHHVNQLPVVSLNQALKPSQDLPNGVAVVYTDEKQFNKFAKQIGLMSQFKDGVPRTGYKGIVSFYKNRHRIYLIPYRTQLN